VSDGTPQPMTQDDFERSYAARSGITVNALRDMGLRVEPCACAQGSCRGWQMTTEHERLQLSIRPHEVPLTLDSAEFRHPRIVG